MCHCLLVFKHVSVMFVLLQTGSKSRLNSLGPLGGPTEPLTPPYPGENSGKNKFHAKLAGCVTCMLQMAVPPGPPISMLTDWVHGMWGGRVKFRRGPRSFNIEMGGTGGHANLQHARLCSEPIMFPVIFRNMFPAIFLWPWTPKTSIIASVQVVLDRRCFGKCVCKTRFESAWCFVR